MFWRKNGWKIGGLEGKARVYKKVLFEQKISRNILDRTAGAEAVKWEVDCYVLGQ